MSIADIMHHGDCQSATAEKSRRGRQGKEEKRHTDRYHCLYASILRRRASAMDPEVVASLASRDGMIVIAADVVF